MKEMLKYFFILILVLLLSGCSDFLIEVSTLDEVGEEAVSSLLDVSITGDMESGSITALSEVALTVTWSEEVSDFTAEDIEVSNAVLSELSGSGTEYIITVENELDSEVVVTICANAVESGNDEVSFTYTFEADALTLEISSDLGNSVNSETVPLSLTFSHSVSDFTVDSLSATGGSFDNFDGSEADYTVDLILAEDGDYLVTVAAGTISSAVYADVTNESASLEIEYDGTSPTAELNSSVEEEETSGADSLTFTIEFSEDVTGFELDDLSCDKGSLDSFSGSGDSYEVVLTPTEDGEVTLTLPAAVCEDSFGNLNEEAAFSYTYDSSKVSLLITSESGEVTSDSTISLTVEFSESVSGLELDDFTVTSGTVQNLDGSEADYTLELIPSEEGDVVVTLPEDSVANSSDGGNSSSTLTVTYDCTAPDTPVFSLTMLTSGDTLESGDYSNEIVVLSLDTDYSGDSGSELSYEYTIDGSDFSEFTSPTYLSEETTYDEINIRVTDEAANSTLGSEVTSLTVDLSSPDSPVVSIETDPVNASNYETFSFTLTSGEADGTYSYTISDESDNGVSGSGIFDSTGEVTLEDIDLSDLEDGEISVQVTQTDQAGNSSGIGQDTTDMDKVVPDEPSVTITCSTPVTSSNNDAFSFDVYGGEAGLTYNYTLSTDGGSTTISDSGEFDDDGEFTVEDLDISSLADGTLTVSVYQTDDVGNVSDTGTDTATLNGTVENDTDVSLEVDSSNVDSYTFTIYGEAGASYTYTITSSNGDSSITDSGEFGDADEVTVTVDLSSLGDGYLVFTVTVTDDDNNSTTVSVVEKEVTEASTDRADFSDSSSAVSFDMSDHSLQTVDGDVVKYDTTDLIGSDYDDRIKFSALEDGEEFTIDGGEGENTIDLTNYPSYNVSLTAGEYDGETLEDGGSITVTIDSDSGETAVIYYKNFQIIEFSTYNFTGSPHTLELDTSDETVWTFSDTEFTVYNPNSTIHIG
ncbi:MAG: Ig-like domain-containing protein, partial [Spirochaetales bacterium]|nr:Ig-like domain-containing protein [Spirochaetales bacterium]